MGEHLPRVSVIMPAYNARQYITEAISSVLDQDYPHLELIVVDDGSSDGTPELAEGFGSRVRVVRQANAGPAAARNKGVSVARGEYIAFLDADDAWLPGKLSSQVAYLDVHSDIGLVYGDFRRWISQPDGSFLPPPPILETPGVPVVLAYSGWIYSQLLLSNVVHIITALVRREALIQVCGFDESLITGEDYDLWLRLSRVMKMVKLNRTCAYYRIHSRSTTNVPREVNNELKVLLRAIENFGLTGPDGVRVDQDQLRRRIGSLYFDHGYLHFWKGKKSVAAESFRGAIRYSPIHIKSWVYFIFSSMGSAIKPS